MNETNAPLSMEFSRREEWVTISYSRGFSQPRDGAWHLLDWQADSLPLAQPGKPINETNDQTQ